MNRSFSLIFIPATLLALAACTSILGDFDSSNATDAGADSMPGTDAASADGTAPTDAAHDALSDAVSTDACQGDACVVTCTAPMTACEGHCVDLTNTGTDCGACGHDCGGGVCTANVCRAQTLADGLGAVKGFGIDSTALFYSTGGTVSSCPLAGCSGGATPYVTLANLSLLAVSNDTVAFVGDDPTISSGNENRSSIFACPGAGCPTPPLHSIGGPVGSPGSFGYNELFGFGPDLYFQWTFNGAQSNHEIVRCVGYAGCNASTDIVTNGLPPLAADATDVYFRFANASSGFDLDKCSNASTCASPTVVVPSVSPTAMTVFGSNVYYVTFYAAVFGGGPVFSCPTAGCSAGTAFGTLQNDTIVDITADASGVYFTGATTIYSCPLAGCPAGGPKVMATGQASPTMIRTDARFVYWVNAGANVSSIVRIAK